jgi:hypothetical protein
MKMRDESDHRAMLDAAKAWRKIKTTRQQLWLAWTTKVGPALVRARVEAMRNANTNQPKGKGYNQSMSALLIEYELDDMDQVTRADLLKIMEQLSAVERWHGKQAQRESLNHPTTVWRRFERSEDWEAIQISLGLKQPTAGDTDKAVLKSLDAKHFTAKELATDDALAAKEHEIEELKSSLAAARIDSITRSVDAARRLPDPPAFDLSTDDGIKDATDGNSMRNHHPDAVRAREQEWQQRDEERAVPPLWLDAAAVHEASHAVVRTALGGHVDCVKLLPNGDGFTGGTTRHDDGLDVIASMICLAAGRAGQRRYGAVHALYDEWAADDRRQMVCLALDLVESQPHHERRANALRLISGAEAVAEELVGNLWGEILEFARELSIAGELGAEGVAGLTKDVERINFRSPRVGEGEVDGVPFRWRDDGYLKPIRQ